LIELFFALMKSWDRERGGGESESDKREKLTRLFTQMDSFPISWFDHVYYQNESLMKAFSRYIITFITPLNLL